MSFREDLPSVASGRDTKSSHWSYYAYGLALILVGLCVGLAVAEILLRTGKWNPPRQIVHGFGLHTLHGAPVWEKGNDRYNRTCVEQHPERIRILFFGSSITFGVGLSAEETFTTALQKRLNQLRPTPGFCVLNFAQPGFAFQQKYAVALDEVPRYKPALIMWESWVEWPEYRIIDDTAYGIGDLAVRPDGFIGMRGVPDSLNRLLFRSSRLYEYLVLSLGERVAPHRGKLHGVEKFAEERLIQVPRLAKSVGAKLVFYLAPPLDQPFAETAKSPPEWHSILRDFARAHQIPVYLLQRELIDQDYLKVRMDPCCHFNAAGHRALVPIMERIILEQLEPDPHAAN
jgi:hypothetical protein